jgi:hypothetical protein
MRNPNYTYAPCPDTMRGGWMVKSGDLVVWGQTKPAARSRLLRTMRHNARLGVKVALPTEQKEEVNDQS